MLVWLSLIPVLYRQAVKESLDTIKEAMAENGRVIVTGCLGAKADIIKQALP